MLLLRISIQRNSGCCEIERTCVFDFGGICMVEKEAIREKIIRLGADVCGFGGMERFSEAPINFRPIDLYSECKSVQ